MKQPSDTILQLPHQKSVKTPFRFSPWASAQNVARFVKTRALSIGLGLLLLCLAAFSISQLQTLAAFTTGQSLRYHTPLTGQAASAARYHAVQNAENAPWPTFWHEDTLPMESELSRVSARCLQYSGEGDLVWPARFVQGGWPGATDDAGCVVSTGLAWRLWGSHDVLGKSLTVDGKTAFVRGVMRDASELCLLKTDDADEGTGWQAAEFRPSPGTQKADIEAFAQASGLGAADVCLSGSSVFALGAFLAATPWLLLFVVLAVSAARHFAHRHPNAFRILLVLLALLLAAALPKLLSLLPGWVVPAKWSDLSHWSALLRQLSAFVNTIIGLAPSLRDIEMKKALLGLLASSCAGGPLLFWFAASLRAQSALSRPKATVSAQRNSKPTGE